MRRSRQVIAIVLLTSALAADGALNAGSLRASESAPCTLAGRLVQRISVGLRRTIAANLLSSRSTTRIACLPLVPETMRPQFAPAAAALLPFAAFRLPPPTV